MVYSANITSAIVLYILYCNLRYTIHYLLLRNSTQYDSIPAVSKAGRNRCYAGIDESALEIPNYEAATFVHYSFV